MREAEPVKGYYILKELNGTRLNGTVTGKRLKYFHKRPVRELRSEQLIEEIIFVIELRGERINDEAVLRELIIKIPPRHFLSVFIPRRREG